MAKKQKDSLPVASIDAKKVRKRSYRSIASIVEAFETKLLEKSNEELQPASFVANVDYKGGDSNKVLLEILKVSKRLLEEGIRHRKQLRQKIGTEIIEHHKKILLRKLTHRQ
jgi:hypothetical protein